MNLQGLNPPAGPGDQTRDRSNLEDPLLRVQRVRLSADKCAAALSEPTQLLEALGRDVLVVVFHDWASNDMGRRISPTIHGIRSIGFDGPVAALIRPIRPGTVLGYELAARLSGDAAVCVGDTVCVGDADTNRVLGLQRKPDETLPNAMILIRGGKIMWVSVGRPPDAPFDLAGLRDALAHLDGTDVS